MRCENLPRRRGLGGGVQGLKFNIWGGRIPSPQAEKVAADSVSTALNVHPFPLSDDGKGV